MNIFKNVTLGGPPNPETFKELLDQVFEEIPQAQLPAGYIELMNRTDGGCTCIGGAHIGFHSAHLLLFCRGEQPDNGLPLEFLAFGDDGLGNSYAFRIDTEPAEVWRFDPIDPSFRKLVGIDVNDWVESLRARNLAYSLQLDDADDIRVLGESLRAIVSADSTDDANVLCAGIDAAKVLAAVIDGQSQGLPEQVCSFLTRVRVDAVNIQELRALAIEALRKIRANSELRRLCNECGVLAKWERDLTQLENRLQVVS